MPSENMISDQEIQKFELEAVETYGFKPEQALGNLRNLMRHAHLDSVIF